MALFALALYLAVGLLIPLWRLWSRPRFPSACVGAIAMTFIVLVVLAYYERYRLATDIPSSMDPIGDGLGIFCDLIARLGVLISIQFVLLLFAVAPPRQNENCPESSDRFRLTVIRGSFLGKSDSNGI